jgi:hypothetical protein
MLTTCAGARSTRAGPCPPSPATYMLSATWPMRGAALMCYARWRERGPLAAVDGENRSDFRGPAPHKRGHSPLRAAARPGDPARHRHALAGAHRQVQDRAKDCRCCAQAPPGAMRPLRMDPGSPSPRASSGGSRPASGTRSWPCCTGWPSQGRHYERLSGYISMPEGRPGVRPSAVLEASGVSLLSTTCTQSGHFVQHQMVHYYQTACVGATGRPDLLLSAPRPNMSAALAAAVLVGLVPPRADRPHVGSPVRPEGCGALVCEPGGRGPRARRAPGRWDARPATGAVDGVHA